MSHLTDRARALFATLSASTDPVTARGESFDAVLARASVSRRHVLRGGVGASLAALLGSAGLSACGGGDDDDTRENYDVGFKKIARSTEDQVTVPEGYETQVLYVAGDALVAGSTAYAGSFLDVEQAEQVAGGNHDGMHYYELPGVDPDEGGLLVINHEYPDFAILMDLGGAEFDPTTATDEQKQLALAAVGVSVVEIAKGSGGRWEVKAGSTYNRRYTGNTSFRVSGPAADAVGATVVGTLNNCSSGATPWGTYLTCEETVENYLDPSQPAEGYGWVVEIDPLGELSNLPVKRTALGRFSHENSAYRLGSDNTVAFYLGDDSTPGCIYKFVPAAKYDPASRAANRNLLDDGTLYAAKFNDDGTGTWLALVQGQNGLVAGATDPGDDTQGDQADVTVDFRTQADVLIRAGSAARVAGATLMDRPEWLTVGPDGDVYCTLTNNSGRVVTDASNPRVENRHGHIIHLAEDGNVPEATGFRWDIVLQAGDPTLATETGNLVGNIDGDTFSSPDGLRVDPQGRMWVQTDQSIPGNPGVEGKTMVDVFGNNGMYYVDPATRKSSRFLVGPVGCEITGLAYTPDLKTFFINIQHPAGTWPSAEQGNEWPARSATIVVRRTDGKPVGA